MPCSPGFPSSSAQHRRMHLLRCWVNKSGQASSEALSDYTSSSSCLRCSRERCCEPYTTTTTIATTPHSARRSHAWFTESAPENIWPTNPLEKVLFMLWKSMTINTLPLALLNSQRSEEH